MLLAVKLFNDSSVNINLGVQEVTNQYQDYFGYDYVKVHSNSLIQTTWNAGHLLQPLLSCNVITTNAIVLEGSNILVGS